VVVRRFDYNIANLGDKYGVICKMLHINMSSQVTKCIDTLLFSVRMHTYEHIS